MVKDMVRPTALGTPQPADGVLDHGDDLMVEFNEDIVTGYINASNIKVTGKVNQQATTHEVSLHLSGEEPTAQTENDLYMRGNSTVAMWLKYTHDGTIFRHCDGDNALIVGIDNGKTQRQKRGRRPAAYGFQFILRHKITPNYRIQNKLQNGNKP